MKIEQQGSYLCNGFHDGIGPDDQIRSAPTAKILVIFGTRSEAIKLAPLIKTLAKERSFNIKICATGQHRELLDQTRAYLTLLRKALIGLRDVMGDSRPDYVLVHGDTTTAMVGALAAFYLQKDVIHIEAGLRTYDISPSPEDSNRRIISQLARFHFTPLATATEHLKNESIVQHVYQEGNTGVDALLLGLKMIKSRGEEEFQEYFKYLDFTKRIILVTSHRRESCGQPLVNICDAILDIATDYPDVEIVYPVHVNRNVREVVGRRLKGISNIKIVEPLSYTHMMWLMSKVHLIITDSGGIQEEALAFDKSLLVLSDVADRMEGVVTGNSVLVGTDRKKIVLEVRRLLDDMDHRSRLAESCCPYGDGTASQRITWVLKTILSNGNNYF